MPAQWSKLSLRTQQEMLAGREALKDQRLWVWADEGEAFLRNQFRGKGVAFHAYPDHETLTIRLDVYRASSGDHKPIFSVVEPAISFVSPTTLTKIIMVCG